MSKRAAASVEEHSTDFQSCRNRYVSAHALLRFIEKFFDTLAFSLLSGVRAMTETFPLERAADAYEHMASGKARFRAVLTTGR